MPDGDRAVLDPEVIDRLVRLGDDAGEDLLAQLASLFLSDAGVRVAAMQAALARGDAAGIAWSAHQLSGASASVGAAELSRLAATFEAASVVDELSDGQVGLEAIEAELDRVRVALLVQTRPS
jgi:HPt (histidine-containing phosphotransfer) domain-containing protein